MKKSELEARRIEARRICELVRNLNKGELLDIMTPFTARQLTSWLRDAKDDEGFWKVLRCQTVRDGIVSVICDGSFKISAVHTNTTTI